MPLSAARAPKHRQDLLENAINEDSTDKEVFLRTEIAFVESVGIVATRNNLKRSCTYAYEYLGKKMVLIAMKPSSFKDFLTQLLKMSVIAL